MRAYLHHRETGVRLRHVYNMELGHRDVWDTLMGITETTCVYRDFNHDGFVRAGTTQKVQITVVMRIVHPEFTVSFA